MIDLDTVETLAHDDPATLTERLLTPDSALQAFPAVVVDAEAAMRFSGGQSVAVAGASTTGLARVYGDGERFLGVGELPGDGQVAPRRVFQLPGKNP
jgi:tRNA pseudouridine55 synthase